MKALSFGKVQRQIVRQDAVPESRRRTRYDLVGLRQFLNFGGSGDQRIVEALHRMCAVVVWSSERVMRLCFQRRASVFTASGITAMFWLST